MVLTFLGMEVVSVESQGFFGKRKLIRVKQVPHEKVRNVKHLLILLNLEEFNVMAMIFLAAMFLLFLWCPSGHLAILSLYPKRRFPSLWSISHQRSQNGSKNMPQLFCLPQGMLLLFKPQFHPLWYLCLIYPNQ